MDVGENGTYPILKIENQDGTFVGTTNYRTMAREVEIVWQHEGTATREARVYPVAFWPTGLVVHGGLEQLCVSGQRRNNGNTVIQRWSFSSPRLLTIVPVGGGEPTYLPRSPNLAQVDTLFNAREPGKGIAYLMAPVQAQPSVFLVQFYDSRDVYRFDASVDPITITRVATSEGPAPDGALVNPALATLPFLGPARPERSERAREWLEKVEADPGPR